MIIYIPLKIYNKLLTDRETQTIRDSQTHSVIKSVLTKETLPKMLKGHPGLYKVKGNYESRFIFKRLKNGWALMDILWNHEYQKLDQIEHRKTEEIEVFEDNLLANHVTETDLFERISALKGFIYTLSDDNELITLQDQLMVLHQNQLLVLTAEQQTALTTPPSASITVICGDGGSGKSSILGQKIIDYGVMFSTATDHSASLTVIVPFAPIREATLKAYQQHPLHAKVIANGYEPVSILTPWALIAQQFPDRTQIGIDEFIAWHKTTSGQTRVKLLTAFNPIQIYSDLILIFALTQHFGQTEAKNIYCGDLFSKSVLAFDTHQQREILFQELSVVLAAYQESYSETTSIDPNLFKQFSDCIPPNTHIMGDEVQNWPPVLWLMLLLQQQRSTKPMLIAMNAAQSLVNAPLTMERILDLVSTRGQSVNYQRLSGTHRCAAYVRELYIQLGHIQDTILERPKRAKTDSTFEGYYRDVGGCWHIDEPSSETKSVLSGWIKTGKAAIVLCGSTEAEMREALGLSDVDKIICFDHVPDIGGLQFPIVIAFNKPVSNELGSSLNQLSLLSEGQRNYLSQQVTRIRQIVSRAQCGVVLIQQKTHELTTFYNQIASCLLPNKLLPQLQTVDAEEDWFEMALALYNHGFMVQAFNLLAPRNVLREFMIQQVLQQPQMPLTHEWESLAKALLHAGKTEEAHYWIAHQRQDAARYIQNYKKEQLRQHRDTHPQPSHEQLTPTKVETPKATKMVSKLSQNTESTVVNTLGAAAPQIEESLEEKIINGLMQDFTDKRLAVSLNLINESLNRVPTPRYVEQLLQHIISNDEVQRVFCAYCANNTGVSVVAILKKVHSKSHKQDSSIFFDNIKFLLDRHQELEKYLAGSDIRKRASCLLIHYSVLKSQITNLQRLKDLGANVTKTLKGGVTLAHLAAEHHCDAILELLITWGTDFNIQDESCRTPIYIAAANQNDSSIVILKRGGADPNIGAPCGSTPICIAAERGFDSTIEILAGLGAEINVVRVNASTPVGIAAQHGRVAAIRALHKLRADLNAVHFINNVASTPLLLAIISKRENSVRTLIRLGVSLDLKIKITGNALYNYASELQYSKEQKQAVEKRAALKGIQSFEAPTELMLTALEIVDILGYSEMANILRMPPCARNQFFANTGETQRDDINTAVAAVSLLPT